MTDNLFQGLPPPTAPQPQPDLLALNNNSPAVPQESSRTATPLPPPALKSALKRSKPPDSRPEATTAPEKRLRFKTTTDASEIQVIEAMQKIASHIKNRQKFSKASKLAMQLIQAGSVRPSTNNHFFAIFDAAMASPSTCNDPSVRADYHALFSAAQDVVELFDKKQRNLLTTWTIRAVVANDLFTDDSFVFSKASMRIKEAISDLPIATKDDDIEEAAALELEDERREVLDAPAKQDLSSDGSKKEESDPFGLDALIPSTSKKDERAKGKNSSKREEDDEEGTKRFLKSKREALILCLEIAAKRYKTPWCQTAIDILVKHAADNVLRFTSRQRDAIEKLWASIREQQSRRKQGKSVTGKLDVNGFEWLQEKYANEKISIRHSVGGSGDRKSQQWLG